MKEQVEHYFINEQGYYVRRIKLRNGQYSESEIPHKASSLFITADDYDLEWLKDKDAPPMPSCRKQLRMADLFCGTGPMSLGAIEAGRATGVKVIPTFAIDFEPTASLNYKRNFPKCDVRTYDITKIINGEIGNPPTSEESLILSEIGPIDLVIAGPPCQGHSDLNNHTRRNDPRNLLIFNAIRFIELTSPKYVIIENVQGIRHDKNDVLSKSKDILRKLGYSLYENLLLASDYGVAQNRRRFILVASIDKNEFDLSSYLRDKKNSVLWAISDLKESSDASCVYETSAQHAIQNKKRIDYLFDHNLYELPNQLRPKCQQKKDNRYSSVYGRMYPDLPAPTITSGFGSIGQGRFAHPLERRTLTPHEAARVQFIPDFFTFSPKITREPLQKLIGNAVPPKLTYVIGVELFR